MLELRQYQKDAINGLIDYWKQGKGSNPILILPTGAGKSLVQAYFCKWAMSQYCRTRIICLTHVKELIEQNEAELKGYWPEAPSGVYSASLNRRDQSAQILFAGIASVYRKAFEFDPFDIAIIDECHLINTKGTGMYNEFLAKLKMANPYLKVIGLTATPFRLDGGSLIGGEKSLFDGVAYNVEMTRLIKEGYLCNLTAKEGIEHIETRLLKTQSGEYRTSDQETAFHKNDLTNKAIKEFTQFGSERKGWLVFCASVDHANEVADILNSQYNIPTKCVHGGLTKDQREDYINQFKAMKLRCLVSVNILTTGFNAKHVDLIVLLRSTKSASLLVQILGRGMRLHPDKQDCLVLDYGENLLNHGPVDQIVERQLAMGAKKKVRKGDPVMKRCKECDALVFASVRICPNCNYQFPISTLPKIHQQAARVAATTLEKASKAEVLDVKSVSYSIHKKPGKPDSLRVQYNIGNMLQISEWVCFDHQGYAKQKAVVWWSKRRPPECDVMAPTTEQAYNYIMHYGIKEPRQIEVIQRGKFYEITRHIDLEIVEAPF